MISIGPSTTIKTLEQSYDLLKGNDVDITILRTTSNSDFGLVPAIIQFFTTWHNKNKNGKIILNVNAAGELDEFYKIDYVFPIIVYCWERSIIDTEGKDLKPLLKELNAKKHEDMSSQKGGGGFKSMLACFDHLSVKKGLLSSFYTDGVFIGNEMEFDYALDKSIRNTIDLNKELRTSTYAPSHLDVVAVIYELMKNTDDWARTDEFNKPLKPNTRGLFMKLHRRTRDSFKSLAGDNENLKDYFSDSNFQANTQNELYFLEISVYDSGIGFIKRNVTEKNDGKTTAKQVGIIKECLIRNNTSAKGVARTYKGQGLDRIMRILNKKGLFWLRTANVSVCRNLRTNTYQEEGTANDITLYDWQNNSSTEYSMLAETIGSVVTLVYPLSTVINA